MAIALDQFWRSNHYEHPPLTDEMVAEAERQLGVKLPAEYLALLRIQNGGYTHGFGFPMTRPTAWAEDHVPLDDLFGIVIDPDHRTAQNILQTAYMTKEWGLRRDRSCSRATGTGGSRSTTGPAMSRRSRGCTSI